MLSINNLAVPLIEELIKTPRKNGVEVHRNDNGKVLIDMGVKVPGSWGAGKKLIEILIGGMGYISFDEINLPALKLSSLELYLDRPVFTCFNSLLPFYETTDLQLAGPNDEKGKNKFLFVLTKGEFQYSEIITMVKGKGINLGNSYILIAAANSLVGSIYQASLGIANTFLVLKDNNFDMNSIQWAWGSAPIAPPVDEIGEMCRRAEITQKYGTSCSIWTRNKDFEIKKILKNEFDISQVSLHNLATARTFSKGRIDTVLLQDELFREGINNR